ncbi:uncharacterized protein PpBr36_06533 [Pyricularia pennisetigena]|uniref:uncharacterized protein n=1 Tax=Pyricularia pennisetigena TaxID=1578925 RepID=UPI001152C12F|nr:uncharacterized protein PpBr36_06533 [Pyricularia pennisetigena]TLS23630.1 hypothetical protein PpBr36_06533 [Pyricularia pennisetigena]
MSNRSNQDNYWVVFYQDAARWMHIFHSSLRSGKSFQAQVVVRYVGENQLTGEAYVRKRPDEKHNRAGRRALRDEAANVTSLARDLKGKGTSLADAHIAELVRKTDRPANDNPYALLQVEASYWKLYNLGSLHGLLSKLRGHSNSSSSSSSSSSTSSSALPALAARVAGHMLIAIKSSLVTPARGLLHNDIVSGNVFVHFPPGGKDKLPDFYLGDWGDSTEENGPRPRFNGVQESLRRLGGILGEIKQLNGDDSTLYDQISGVLSSVCSGAPKRDRELLKFLAKRLDKAVERADQLEKTALEAAAGSIDPVHAILKSFVIVPGPTRYRTEEEAEAAVESRQLRGCTLQLVEKGKIDFTKGKVAGESDSSSSSDASSSDSSMADLVGDSAGSE